MSARISITLQETNSRKEISARNIPVTQRTVDLVANVSVDVLNAGHDTVIQAQNFIENGELYEARERLKTAEQLFELSTELDNAINEAVEKAGEEQ